MSKEETLQAVFDLLQECGWMPDGQTRSETVRVPTSRSPVYGGMGGELRSSGGRQRFRKMDWFCTAGPRTVNFYQRGEDGPVGMVQAKSKDLDAIRKLATEKGN